MQTGHYGITAGTLRSTSEWLVGGLRLGGMIQQRNDTAQGGGGGVRLVFNHARMCVSKSE